MVSVIVPAYNVQRYLDECIRSVLLQSYVNLELVLVDDGSTDATGEICDRYARLDGRVQVLHTANSGPSAARNAGIDASCGDYLIFVDADDLLHEDAVKIMLDVAENADADVVCCDYFCGKEPLWPPIKGGKVRVYTPQEAIIDTLYQRNFTCSPCSKLYRRNIFDGERYKIGLIYEDLEIFPRIFACANKVVYLPEPIYFYRNTPGSILHVFTSRRFDVLKVTDRMERKYSDPSQPKALRKAAVDRKFSANFNMFILASLDGGDYGPEIDQCWYTVKKYRWRVLMDKNSRLKNKLGALLSLFGRKLTLKVAKRYYK